MKILLDENLPHELRALVKEHDVFTVSYRGWSGTKNGALLQRAADDGFDLMITMDNGVAYQQNTATLPIVLIVSAVSNDIEDLRPLVPPILVQIDQNVRARSRAFHSLPAAQLPARPRVGVNRGISRTPTYICRKMLLPPRGLRVFAVAR